MDPRDAWAKSVMLGLNGNDYPSREEFGEYLAINGPESYFLAEWIEKTGCRDGAMLTYQDCEFWGRRGAGPSLVQFSEDGEWAYFQRYEFIDKSKGIRNVDVESSTLVENATGECWHDVRVVPLLAAPDIGSVAAGNSLKEAFHRFVLREPIAQFHAQQYRRASDDGAFAEFDILTLFDAGRAISFENWFIAQSCVRRTREIADRFDPSKGSVHKYLSAVVSNASLLVNRLARGMVLSDGFWRGDTRERLPIDPQLWTRSDLKLDLRNGDLVNAETSAVEWASIVLRATTSADAVGLQPSDVVAGARLSQSAIEPPQDIALKPERPAKRKRPGKIAMVEQWVRENVPEPIAKSAKELLVSVEAEMPNLGEFSERSMSKVLTNISRKP